MEKKHIKSLTVQTMNHAGGCGECQTSCQSACKTSCTVGNQACASNAEIREPKILPGQDMPVSLN